MDRPLVFGADGLASELRSFEQLIAELAATAAGLGADHIDGAIDDALRRIVGALHIDRATLIQVTPLSGRIAVTHSWADAGLPRVPPLDAPVDNPWALAQIRAGRPVVVARLDDAPPQAAVDRQTWARIGLKSQVSMPIHVAGELLGALNFGALRQEREWPPELLARMRLLADLFAGQLARQRAEQRLQSALDFERLATRILGALLLADGRGEREIVEAGLRDIAGLLGADRAVLWEAEGGDGVFRRTRFWFSADLPAADTWQLEQLPWMSAQLAAELPVRCAQLDMLPPQAAVDRDSLQALGVRSLLALPVVVDGALVGVFSMAAVRAACDWPESLLPGMRMLADVFATLHVRRKAEARQQAAQAEATLWRERFAHMVRVHTVGEMSTALAHEITQPLGAIENYALAARRRVDADDPDLGKVRELLDRIVAQATRAGDVVMRMRAMVKRHEPALAPVSLGRVAQGCVDLLRGVCEARAIDVEIEQPSELPLVMADEIHVQQVLLNLLRNAIEAMEAAVPEAQRRIDVRIAQQADMLSVAVSDHGPGIAEADLERVFEAFHSTKAEGLGVGLAICRRLIEAHGGTLHAARRPGGGAIFTFTLPLVAGAAA